MFTNKSMLFNGVYFEEEIEGYTTIGVSGRERVAVETKSLSIGNRDGSIFRGNTYKSRTLTISFIIEGGELDFNPDETELIDRINKLNALLDVEEEVEIIFADEPDKFYMGVPTGSPSMERSLGIVKGSFQIFCADPFKYSTEIHEAYPVSDSDGYKNFVIDYGGTHKSYPTYEAQFYTQNRADSVDDLDLDITAEDVLELQAEIAEDPECEYWRNPDAEGTEDAIDENVNELVVAELLNRYPDDKDITTHGNEDELISGKGACGYVAFFDDENNILQFGNPDATEKPIDPKEYTNNLLDQKFMTTEAWADVISKDWVMNSVKNLPNVEVSSSEKYKYNQQGYFKISNAKSNEQSYSLSTSLGTAKGTGVTYSVSATAKNRKSGSVAVDVTVKYKFSASVPWDGIISANVTVGGVVKSKTVKSRGKKTKKKKKTKTTGAFAKGKSGSFTLSFSVSDLTAYQDSLGVAIEAKRSGGKGSTGKCSNTKWTLYIPIYVAPQSTTYYLTAHPSSFVGTNKGEYYGSTASRMIPADFSGNKGWTDFKADFEIEMAMNKTGDYTKEMGAIYVGVTTGDIVDGQLKNEKVLAGGIIQKSAKGNSGKIYPVKNGEVDILNAKSVDLQYLNEDFGLFGKKDIVSGTKTVTTKKTVVVKDKKGNVKYKWVGKGKKRKKVKKTKTVTVKTKKNTYKSVDVKPNRHIVITKQGDSLDIQIGSKVFKYTDNSISNLKGYSIFIGVFGYSGQPYIPWIGILSVGFKPLGNISSPNYIPFSTGDLLYADAGSGEVFLNEEERPDLGALGNDWEQMCLYPGINQIGAVYSEWCNDTAYRRQNGNDEFDPDETYYAKSGESYTKVTVTETTFNSNKSNYYILEECSPEFTIRYREVYV
nr:MAG TPA: distal tail protein [Caudoviricetes sp.]